MNANKVALLVLFMMALVSAASAEIEHITMRVEGMT